MQFSVDETAWAGSVLEAYERLILDAVKGDHTLFTTAEGVERLWEISEPLVDDLPPVRPYADGPGVPTRSTNSSLRAAGGCRSSGSGATRGSRPSEPDASDCALAQRAPRTRHVEQPWESGA